MVYCLALLVTVVSSNVSDYSITSSLLCCHLECKGFVLGPGMSAIPSNMGCYSIAGSLLCCTVATLSVKGWCWVLV